MDDCNAIKMLLMSSVMLMMVITANCLKFDEDQNNATDTLNPHQQQQPQLVEGRQSARHLFDFIGLGTGNNVDPYLRKTNEKCLNGDFSECFKSQALNSVDDIFIRDSYV
jgi:hypothetical protein